MSQDREGEAHTIGLLLDLREVCARITQTHAHLSSELHEVLRSIANPNLFEVSQGPRFSIEQWSPEHNLCVRMLAVTNHLVISHMIFDKAVELYPKEEWRLCDKARIMRRYPEELINRLVAWPNFPLDLLHSLS